MTKPIMSATDYAVKMIDVMVTHDQAGAMPEWVDGMVKSWIIKLLISLEDNQNDTPIGDRFSFPAKQLILRAVNTIPEIKKRSAVKATCLVLGIISLGDISIEEESHVKLVAVDR